MNSLEKHLDFQNETIEFQSPKEKLTYINFSEKGSFGIPFIMGTEERALEFMKKNGWLLLGARFELAPKMRMKSIVALSNEGLIIDRAYACANILSRIFRESTLEMCKCSHECYHKRFRAKAKALIRISDRHLQNCDEATKLRRMKLLRLLYNRHEVVDVELILNWISENGLPRDLNSKCHDVLQWAVANDCRLVLAKAKEREAIQLKHIKAETDTPEKFSESAAAQKEETRLLAMFKKEYANPDERRQKISQEIGQIRIELGKPDLAETDGIVAYAIGRICRRIELALPLLGERAA